MHHTGNKGCHAALAVTIGAESAATTGDRPTPSPPRARDAERSLEILTWTTTTNPRTILGDFCVANATAGQWPGAPAECLVSYQELLRQIRQTEGDSPTRRKIKARVDRMTDGVLANSLSLIHISEPTRPY